MSEVQLWVAGGATMVVLAVVQLFRSKEKASLRQRVRRFVGQLFDVLGG